MYFSTNMAQRYILKLHGTGQLMSSRKGDWVKKGRVQSSEPIGVYIDRDGNAQQMILKEGIRLLKEMDVKVTM